jgi:hypothetical protein
MFWNAPLCFSSGNYIRGHALSSCGPWSMELIPLVWSRVLPHTNNWLRMALLSRWKNLQCFILCFFAESMSRNKDILKVSPLRIKTWLLDQDISDISSAPNQARRKRSRPAYQIRCHFFHSRSTLFVILRWHLLDATPLLPQNICTLHALYCLEVGKMRLMTWH